MTDDRHPVTPARAQQSTPPAASNRAPGRFVSLVAMILLPLLIAAGALWVTSGIGGRTQRAEAAIVNLDEGAQVGDTRVRLGQEYALQLKNQQGPNFSWRYGVSVADAEEGLASGRYSAAVIIPGSFSRVLTGTSQGKAKEQATLVVERSPVSGVSEQVVFSQLSAAATNSLSGAVTRKYLDQVFVTSTAVGTALGKTSTAAQEAYVAAGTLSEQASQAQQASASLGAQADESSRTAESAARNSREAADTATSAGVVGTAAGATAVQVGRATAEQAKALEAAAARANKVAEAAAKARTESTDATDRARLAGEHGGATEASTKAMAEAAKANREAAENYTGKVADVARKQVEVQQDLARMQETLQSYVGNVQVVTAAVRQVSATQDTQPAVERIVTEQSEATPAIPTTTTAPGDLATAPADEAADDTSAGPVGPVGPALVPPMGLRPLVAQFAAPAALPLPALAPQAQPARVLPQNRAERDAIATELRAAATALRADDEKLTALQEQADATAAAAKSLQQGYDALVDALPTKNISLNNGVGAGSTPAACRGLESKEETRACKTGYEKGYNVAVAEVNAALAASKLGAQTKAIASQSAATLEALRGLRTSSARTADNLDKLATRLDAIVLDDAEPTPQPTATVTVTATPEPQPTATATASTPPQPDPTAEPGPSGEPVPVPQPTATVTVTVTPAPSEDPSAAPSATPTPGGDTSAQPSAEPSVQPSSAPGTPDATPAPGAEATVPPALGSTEVREALVALDESAVTMTTQLGDVTTKVKQGEQALATVSAGSDAAQQLTNGAESITTAATAQTQVVTQLQQGLDTLNEGMAGLNSTITGLAGEAAGLQDDTSALSDNATRMAERTTALTESVGALAAAATESSGAANRAAADTAALQQQITGLQQSSGVVATQTTTVVDSANEQATRTDDVASRVEQARVDLPVYDDAERERITEVVGRPIETEQASAFRNVGWVSMLMLLSLWAGSMGLHSAFNPVSNRARRSTAAPERLLAREMLPGAGLAIAQALAVSGVGQVALNMPLGRWAAVTAALILASLAFAAVNHSLVAFLRVFGRIVAAAFALVAGATMITQSYPPALEVLRLLSPVSPAVDLVRGVMTGAGGTPTDMARLLGWLAAGTIFSALAILRARNPEPVRVPSVRDSDPS